jgi:hypothetical protein
MSGRDCFSRSQVARHFGVKPDKARTIAGEVGGAVKRWRQAKARGLSATQIDRMVSAFENEELKKAASEG